MPDPVELPRPQRSVVPLMFARFPLVAEVVADRLPGRTTVIRALNHLTEPPTGLRGIDPVRIQRRRLEVIDLPAGEVRAVDLPVRAAFVRGEDEGPLAGPDENTCATHPLSLSPSDRPRRYSPGPTLRLLLPRRIIGGPTLHFPRPAWPERRGGRHAESGRRTGRAAP